MASKHSDRIWEALEGDYLRKVRVGVCRRGLHTLTLLINLLPYPYPMTLNRFVLHRELLISNFQNFSN